jgi:hypothetical protein
MKKPALLLLGFLVLLNVQHIHANAPMPRKDFRKMDAVVMVEIINPANFSGFKFYLRKSLIPGVSGIKKKYLQAGKQVRTGGRNFHSYLLHAKDAQGIHYVSKNYIYEFHYWSNWHRVDPILLKIKVLSVENGEVEFVMWDWGRTRKYGKKMVKGEVEMNGVMMIVPVTCLLGLATFLIFRGKCNAID